ncbi:tetratricopeptide repeat-containing sulfotransferase family protein [Thalassotalea profundi]|uniref:Sulfotransferase n=1 Tax=Thalassotalea profundi TaxID=2036687 RepID=A0ABQ3J2K3_9GAMM|nr:tetratricopeptide repeat-containing sulfotransferase family protein [Thalassotalea profundi]GHE98319.1 sulfotransferase [Thalassotalea profundi]
MNNTINTSSTPNFSLQEKQQLLLAEQAFGQRDLQKAESIYRSLIKENISLPEPYSQLALICAMTNRIDEARSLWSYVLEIHPQFIGALLGLGDICKFEKNYTNAINYYQKVTLLNKKHALSFLNISYCLKQLGKFSESETACKKAITISPNYKQAKEFLGELLVIKGDFEQANKVLNQLISEEPNNVKALYSLGNLLKSKGDFDQAKSCYQKIFLINPEYTQAHFTYSTIHKYLDKNDPHIQLMLTQYSNNKNTEENKIQLSFALAKAYEDIQEYSKSFQYLTTGNQLRFERYNYDISSDQTFIKNIIEVFNKDAINALSIKSNSSNTPIFIVGMPRSGTSLVEKILSTHTEVHGAGELDYFFQLGTSALLSENSNYLFSPLNNYANELFQQMGNSYIEKLNLLNHKAKYVTDKLPFNMLLIGLIKVALPNAKIIHCVRDPKDNYLSIFKKNFTTDNYRFAYNLTTLGQFHHLYSELMAHWHSVFPDSIYDIEYESLISDPENEIKKLINICNLDWQEECLKFHKSEAIVTTASAFQVRQPIYNSSIGIWKKYETFLTPLLKELDSI